MTGDPTPHIRTRAAVADVLAVLEKPFQGSELVALVQSAFDGRSQRAGLA